MNIKQQTSKNKVWTDEQGLAVPYNRISPLERMKEKYAYALATKAFTLQKGLIGLASELKALCMEVFTSQMSEKELKKATKGNFTWYNFDGSIKIEVRVNENIEFDGILIEKCRQRLLDVVGDSIDKDKAFIKELVMSAFQTSNGRLDTKKIMSLKKYASKIPDKRYQEAMKFLDESIRRPDSRTYFCVWVRNEGGNYVNIDLNMSSVLNTKDI